MDPDPWNWTVTDVQTFFREQATDYIKDLPHGKLPESAPFLATLDTLEVDGYALLNHVDIGILRNDCGVRGLGVAGAVMRCVDRLRRHSRKYAAEHGLEVQPLPTAVPNAESPEAAVPIPAQAVEIEIEGGRDRKRRRLDISTMQTVQPQSVETNIARSVFQAQALSMPASIATGYLPDTSTSVDSMFFGSTTFGHVVENAADKHAFVLQTYHDVETAEDNFQFIRPAKTSGECHVAHNRMRHFLSNTAPIELRRQGLPALAILPFRDSGSSSARAAMVVQFKDGSAIQPVTIKEHASGLDREDAETEAPSVIDAQVDDELEYFRKKYAGTQDDVLEAWGDEKGDNESLESTDDENEGSDDGEPQAEESEPGDTLTLDQVDEIMEEHIQGCIKRWQERLPQFEANNAHKTWERMQKSRSIRATLIQSEEARIDFYTEKLNKAKAELRDERHEDEGTLRWMCATLDGSIENRELSRWKVSIWQSRQEPGRVVRSRQSRSRIKSHASKSVRPSFVPRPEDRLSFSPAARSIDDDEENAMQLAEDEVIYEADDEQVQTPAESTGDFGLPLDVDESMDEFVVPDDNEDEADSPNRHEHINGTIPVPDDPTESSYNPQSERDATDDELPSPSQLVNKVKKELSSRTPSTPIKLGHVDAVDLTELRSSETPKRRGRPPKNASTPATKTASAPATKKHDFDSDPLKATASEVESWDLSERAKAKDRHRLLILLLRDAGEQVRNDLRNLMKRLFVPQFRRELELACQAVQSPGIWRSTLSNDDLAVILEARQLYSQWFFPSSAAKDKPLSPQDLAQLLNNDQMQFFTQVLQTTLSKTNLFNEMKALSSRTANSSTKLMSSARAGSSSAAPVVIASSSDDATADKTALQQRTPHKVRKRHVRRDAGAHNSRKSAAERQKRFEESQGADSARLVAMVASDASSRVEINPVRDEGHEPIYIIDSIARSMKPHQIDGIRFLWRELTAQSSEGQQGCILAHTMGLGKTMQTIALLAAFTEASHDDDEGVYSQLPPHICTQEVSERQIRVLVLCPPSLITNWRREIEQWAYNSLGIVYSLDSATTAFHSQYMEDWMRFGGVLLVGYQMFRNRVNKSNKTSSVGDESKRVRHILLKGPEVVVADEAHHLKNQASGVAVAASQILTQTRIGLTGTPMSNDVQEIYALVSFVAPRFLGDPVEFKAHYTEPIERGLYQDSTHYEKRKSLMKLKVLHADIQPKVHRANIEVLRGSLRPKVEFVLTVPLGTVQTELYRRTIAMLLRDGRTEKASSVAIFGWLSVLTLLTNHPHCFRERLLASPKPRVEKKSKRKSDVGDLILIDDVPTPTDSDAGGGSNAGRTDADASESDPHSEPVHALGFTEDIIAAILDGFDNDKMAFNLSSKVAIFFELLEYCLACKDKVLIFSSNILTLDFLGQLLRTHQIRFGGFGRIAGQTPMHLRTATLERFHNNEFDIMLVSTRAGGVGLNIQGANRVFIFDFQFNPAHEEQAIGRAYRLGQTKPVFVYRFVAGGTFEQNIENKQMFKTSLAQRVVDKKNPKRYAEKNTREYLYSPKEVRQQGLEEWIGKDPLVLDKLLAQHGDGPGQKDTLIRAIKTMETLQEDAMDAPLDELEQKEVDEAIQAGRNRARGKNTSMAPPSSQQFGPAKAYPATAGPSTQVVRLKTKKGWEPAGSPIGTSSRPPASTYDGILPAARFMGGLPFSGRGDSD